MKPLHVGLLVVGAAIAGALAVKMTEPPSLPLPARHASVQAVIPNPHSSAVRAVSPPVLKNIAVSAPAPSFENSPKAPEFDTAPPPVYSELRHASVSAEPASVPAQRKLKTPEPKPAGILASKPRPFPAPPQQEPVANISANLAPPVPYQPPPDLNARQSPSIQQVEEPSAPRQVILKPGALVTVRVMETLSSDRVSPGDAFGGSLAEPLIIDGFVIAERGARVDGRIVAAARPSRLNGRAQIQLALTRISTADGQRIAVSTEPWSKVGAPSGATHAGEIGGGAALGAIIGAIAGGGTGAAIGAGIGSAAGMGTAIATKSRPVTVPTESVIRFRVNSPVTITERQL
jgi:hypothetical protein